MKTRALTLGLVLASLVAIAGAMAIHDSRAEGECF